MEYRDARGSCGKKGEIFISKNVTLEELAACPDDWLRADPVAAYLRTDPRTLRKMAHESPALLGFPVTVLGKRVLIPKQPFLRFFGWEENQKIKKEEPKHE